ncbi:MAG: ATP-binding protein [Cytophagales bacterium]
MKLNTTLYILIAGFLCSLLIFGVAIYTTYKSEDSLFADFKEVEEAHGFTNDLKEISNLINSIENSHKSFEVSRDDFFLDQLTENENLLVQEIERINNRLIDRSLDNLIFLELRTLIAKRINLGRERIEKMKSKSYSVESDKESIDEENNQKRLISSKIQYLNDHQQKVLNKKHNDVISKFMVTRTNLIVVGFSALLFTILIFVFIWQYSKTHKKIENDLLELNENKNKFFSIISHDLRGPVKNIVLMAQLLYQPANKTIDPEKIARLIESSSNNLSSLLDNLLKWSRLQMNKIEFLPEFIDLQKIADDVIQNLNVHAGQKSIAIINNLQPSTIVFVDQNMIATVIRNLISNSLKFTNKGGEIEIYAKMHTDSIEVIIRDNGVGMPKDIAAKIFSIDFRHITKGTNKEEGTGLGLKLCKEFVEKNRGKIWVESEVGVGSKFIFSIPLQKS